MTERTASALLVLTVSAATAAVSRLTAVPPTSTASGWMLCLPSDAEAYRDNECAVQRGRQAASCTLELHPGG